MLILHRGSSINRSISAGQPIHDSRDARFWFWILRDQGERVRLAIKTPKQPNNRRRFGTSLRMTMGTRIDSTSIPSPHTQTDRETDADGPSPGAGPAARAGRGLPRRPGRAASSCSSSCSSTSSVGKGSQQQRAAAGHGRDGAAGEHRGGRVVAAGGGPGASIAGVGAGLLLAARGRGGREEAVGAPDLRLPGRVQGRRDDAQQHGQQPRAPQARREGACPSMDACVCRCVCVPGSEQ